MNKHSPARYMDFGNKTRWYVVANRTNAAIYTNRSDNKFHLLGKISNPEGSLRDTDLDSDKPGRGFSSAAGGIFHHTLDRRNEQHSQLDKKFAKNIGCLLECGLLEHQFESLVIVAEPHFLGVLRESLSLPLQRTVEHVIAHHYEGTDDELRNKIFGAIEAYG